MVKNTQLILYKPSVVSNGYFQDSSSILIDDGGTQPWDMFYYGDLGIFKFFTGYIQHIPDFINLAAITQKGVAFVGNRYQVKITVTGMTVGSSASIFFGNTTSVSITADGSYTFNMLADPNTFAVDTTIADFNIEVSSNFGGKISKVSVIPIPTDYFLDLGTDVNIPLNFSIADIRTPEKRQSTYSKTVTIPGSKHNNQIFNEIFEIDGDGSYNPNKFARAVVIEDGIQIFEGNLQLTNILRNHSGFNDYNYIQYEVNLLGKLSDFFSKIQDLKLTDLDFSEFTHFWDEQTIRESWFGQLDTAVSGTVNIFGLSNTVTVSSVTMATTVTGDRVQLNFSSPHSFVLGDYLDVTLDPSTGTQLDGFHTIYEIASSTSIIINYGWLSITNPLAISGTLSPSAICSKVTATPTILGNGGYVYPMIDYDGAGNSYLSTSSFWNLNKFFPAIYLRTYIDKIFKKAGYTYNSNFFESDLFNRLIVPYANPADTITMTIAESNNRKFKALQTTTQSSSITSFYTTTGHLAQTSPYYVVSLPNESTLGGTDPGGVFNNTFNNYYFENFPITSNYNLYWNGSFNFTQLTNTTPYNTQTVPGATLHVEVRMVNLATSAVVATSTYSYPTIAGSSTYVNYSLSAINQSFTSGSKIQVQMRFYVDASKFRITSSSSGEFPNNIQFDFNFKDSVFYNDLTSYAIVPGNLMDLNNTIPKNFKITDFMVDIIRMFNLYIQEDKVNEKNLLIEPRNDFYSKTDVVDWTEKLDISEQIEIKPVGDLTGKIYTYSYKEDKDFLNDDHQKDHQHTYGWHREIIDNDFLTATVDTKLSVFSPTPTAGPTQFYAGKSNYYLPFMANGPSFTVTNTNIRLLFFAPRGADVGQYWNFGSLLNPSTAFFTTPGQYPYAGHLDNVFGPTIDLNFGYPDEVYYSFTTWTNNNLYNNYYSDFIFEITNKNSKVVTAHLKLMPYDIFSLDFRRLYLIDGHYLRLNKIMDYSVASDGMTQCEFIKAERGVQPLFSALRSTDVDLSTGSAMSTLRTSSIIYTASSFLGGDNLMPSMGDTTSRMGTGNTIGSGTGIDVVGNDNYVGFNVSDITIRGNNNIVNDNLSNITIINTNNITALTSGETWIGGIYISPTGVVSNLSVNFIDAGLNDVLSPFGTAKLTNFIDAAKDTVLDFGGAEIIHLMDGAIDEVI